MKKEKEFNSSNMITIIMGVMIVLVGIILVGDLSPVKEWGKFQEFIVGYGSNASLVLGGAVSLIGVIIVFVGLKTNN